MLCGLLVAAASPLLEAANNPLNTVPAESFSDKSAGVKVEPCPAGGSNLASIRNGDYVAYKQFDFDSGVAAFKVRLSTPKRGKIEIHLDSLTGPLMGVCAFTGTGGWESYQDSVCKVDNSLAGVRDVYLVFVGVGQSALVNVNSFVFLKSQVDPSQLVDLSGRLDVVDDEPQAAKAWGIPETGFSDDFTDGLKHWISTGITADTKSHSAVATGSGPSFAYTPNVYINKTDTGGEWRTMAEAALSADLVADSNDSRPGIGFASKDGKQSVYVVLNVAKNLLEAHRKLLDGPDVIISSYPKPTNKNYPPETFTLKAGVKYRLQLDWSPYSNALIAFLSDDKGANITSFRTVIDLPAARRPMLISSGGTAHFGAVKFDPTLDGWNYKWEWKKKPVLSSDVCNPAIWKGKDGTMYMIWRKFGADSYHGLASSPDGVEWTRVNDQAIMCGGDMNIVIDPFGDGLNYITGGGANAPWYTSSEESKFSEWKKSALKVGDIFGNSRIQEIIDTKRFPQMKPVSYNGKEYRFIGYTENWVLKPAPRTVILLSNTLTDWVQVDPTPIIQPSDTFWGEKGNAVGSAFVLPDGNLLLAVCACTHDGYTGASEPSNVSAIADGKEPWKILKLGILPDAPVSREGVWYQGPNFGTAYCYDEKSDTLFYYGGFHDYEIGVMRVRNFLHPEQKH